MLRTEASYCQYQVYVTLAKGPRHPKNFYHLPATSKAQQLKKTQVVY